MEVAAVAKDLHVTFAVTYSTNTEPIHSTTLQPTIRLPIAHTAGLPAQTETSHCA